MQGQGRRWLWPALAGLLALGVGDVSGWVLLQHVGIALFGVLFLGRLLVTLSLSSLSARGTSLVPAVMAGEQITVRYVLRNRGFWPLAWAMLEPHGFASVPVQPQFVAVGARRVREIDVRMTCMQRGYWAAGGWTVHAGDPFGLFERSRTASGVERVVVYPRPIPLPGFHLAGQSGQVSRRRGDPMQQASVAIRDVRLYRPGDPPSRIHWLSSARLDRLVVKEPEGEPAAHAWLILDLEDRVQYGTGDGDSVEVVVGAASTVLQRLVQLRLATGLLVAGTSTVFYPEDRAGTAEHLLSALAGVHAGGESVQRSLHLLRRYAGLGPGISRGTMVVVTPWADERWRGVLAHWVGTGRTVFCVLVDTPESGLGEDLALQAARLRAAGVRVYRLTSWGA